ncbi:DUF7502 family protein [Salinirarus marinus]|uniref:DUF7502 family protein n=1 Tax=Salinirarus marinus TaxID=3068310 RepID=UPI003C6CA91D
MNDETAAPRMRRAIRQIRREGYKIAVVYAVVDAAVATLLSNLLLQILDVPVVPERLPLPDVVVTALERVGVALSDPTVAAASVVGVVVGLLVFAAEAVIRARRPLVEQFEAANPDVREALRTARDAVEDGLKNRIARSLYEDVLDELRHASSVGLLDVRRVAVTLALVIALSFVNIQVAVVDVSIGGFDGSATPQPNGDRESTYTGLQNGSSILGDPTNVSAGDDELEAGIETSGDGTGNASDVPRAYDTSGFAAGGTVESQQAGFSETERLEDAELIREYNLRIRENE